MLSIRLGVEFDLYDPLETLLSRTMLVCQASLLDPLVLVLAWF